jgi:carboxypeptidase Taq
MASGEYRALLGWLRERVHRHGQRFETPRLMVEATGETTQARYRIEYLHRKYASKSQPD